MKRILILGCLAALLTAGPAYATEGPPSGTNPPETPPTTPCACCVDNAQDITSLQQRITILEQARQQDQVTINNLTNYLNELNNKVTTIINRPQPLQCESRRVYRFTMRTQIQGSKVTRVMSVSAAGSTERGSFEKLANGRFRVSADYRGVVAPEGQLRSVVVFVRTADGKRYRTVQLVRLCLDVDDGNPNDTPAQDRAPR